MSILKFLLYWFFSNISVRLENLLSKRRKKYKFSSYQITMIILVRLKLTDYYLNFIAIISLIPDYHVII